MPIAKRFLARGRVQGVGYRDFAQRAARELGVNGYVRNLDDGSVEVYAAGEAAQLHKFVGRLYAGPRGADVRSLEVEDVPVLEYEGFHIKFS